MKRLLTATDVAERLGITEDAIYRLTRQKVLRGVRIGRTISFDEHALEEWIQKGGQAWNGGWRKNTR
ncbi:MAG: helix-turn-helix domain-containing protein [Alicyclobacillaceae bacterium]|nr:helix-turn-helix domain-containing protein [Alicyclobacillaceae bacterium]